ncbi:DNA-dependent protein kinase catalytic subunit-like [Episyrphus balteatus]|uniref:DNA-dependent protein kinase catalytic subunit-like n=1 Tax=Episyrphus balteatus TaxID=286459 RepID=UPI00248626D0|nr:DNA-dependent protein kinase catalytic subunit-like [Episyrphus balteatus]
MSTKSLQLERIKELLNSQNPLAAKEYIDDIVNFFDAPLTKVELDLALEKLFSTKFGTIFFLKNSLKANKLFHESNVNIFTLWYNLLTKNVTNANFVPYSNNIIQCCIQFIASSIAPSAKERERATMVLQVLFENKLVDDDLATEVLERSLNIFNLKKPPEMFAQQVFKLLGIIARYYPASVSDEQAQRIKIECFKTLDANMVSQDVIRYRALTGAMECLNDYLYNFAPSPESEPETCDRIYMSTKTLSILPDDIAQKTAFRAGLDIFTHHSTLFSKQIYRDFKFWHECLGKWLGSGIYDERRRGVYGSYAFHKIIAEELKTDGVNCKNTLEFVLNEFRKTLESPDSKPAETRIAIRGFGSMSLLCKQYLPTMLEDMISLVVQKCDLILMADDTAMRDLLDHFPDYIHALSTVIKEIQNPQISDILAENLKNIMIRLIRDFHYLPQLYCGNVANSICNAFNALYLADVTLLERLLNKVIFEGVVWTCSHKHTFDANADWSENIDWKDNITYKSFSILWEAILDESSASRSYDKSIIVDRIFDHLMLTLFKILEKLDLRTKKRVYIDEDGKDQELHFCDPNFDLSPIKPKDFHIFINLVDFYRDLWPKFQRQYTLNWIEKFCERMVKFALRYPLISGFLKLLEVGLKSADQLRVFADNLTPSLEVTLAHAFKIMIIKCQRVSGELQIATIELVLQYPVKFYRKSLLDMIPVFETAFNLGKSMAWLANLAITCLEKISKFNDSEDLKTLYEKVLPLLDSYLQGQSNIEYLSIREGRGGNKIRKTGKSNKTHIEFYDIQAKIVSLLGTLHPEAAAVLVNNSAKNENLVKWDSQKCVHLNLKLPDMSLTIQLDALVPRICHLALTSTDRQTKIAACELVHALVLYLIGARGHRGQIWKELCSKVLELGCDGDATVQQIFEPLLMQVMHFMSKYENLDRGVEEIMDALMDGISSKSNFGLRDLSASCLREFVEWSIKQTTPQQLAASPVSIEIILGRLKMYSFDSDASKRVGAALAFNNLYRRLREEESICDIFFVELLHTFCVNFKLSEELTTMPPNDDTNPDLEMISDSLDHILRVLSERSYLFEKESSKRRVPSALKSGTLRDILKFLIFEAGSKKIFYRRKCIKLAHSLAPRITGLGSVWDFFQTDSFSDDNLRTICEGSVDVFGIRARPDISFLELLRNENPVKSLYNWLEYLLGSLECYIWLLREKAIYKGKHFFRGTNILCAIECFLDKILWKPITDIIENPSSSNITEISNNMDVLKCLIVIHIVDFLIEFLQSECALEEGDAFWTPKINQLLQDLVLQLIYEPKSLHLDFRLEKIFSQLDNRVQKFCKQIQTNCPNTQLFSQINQEMFVTLVRQLDSLSQEMSNMFKIGGAFATKPSYVSGILHILKITNFEEMDSSNLQTLIGICDRIMKLLFDGIKRSSFGKEVAVTLTENIKSFANSLMRIAFGVKDYSQDIVEFLLNDVELYTANLDSKIKHGQLYFELYEKVIYHEVALGFFEKCFGLFPTINDDQQSYLLRILTGILEYKSKSTRSTSTSFRNIIDTCIQNLQILIENYAQKQEEFYFIEFLRVLASIASNDPMDINEQVPALGQFIITKLSSTQLNLEKKCKIITILPLMVGVNDFEKADLMAALEHLQCQHFPLRSTEFAKNSLQETSLKFAFVTLLNALVGSKSYVLLEFLFKCTASDETHLMEDIIRKELKSFTICLSDDQQVEVLKRTLTTVLNESYEPTIRTTIYRRFLLNIFINCSEEALLVFFKEKIKLINMLVESNYRVGTSGRAVEQALANRIIGYGLIEHFFGTVRKELYWSVTCPIAIELLGKQPNSGGELVGTFTKKAFYVRTEVFSTENKEVLELFRQYQSSAYCALCSLVSNTQTELKFYSKFLFEENSRKNELIWARLVDCSSNKHYAFSGQEMEEYAKIKKRFVSIRKLDVRPSVKLNQITSSRRLQTQNIMESSLSQDVRGIDMTSYSVRPYAEALKRQEFRSAEIQSVRLENHDVNKHEVMAMLCGVIKFMYSNNITPVIADTSIKRSYPWVQAIANSIGSCESHKNIRVFLAQVVDNCNEVFQQFAHVLFKPILRMLVDECAGSTLNFFITDMIAMLVTWSSKNLHQPHAADEVSLVQELLKFVMKNAWSETREILKFNLEIVQTMLSVWKDVITVPTNLLLDMITRTQRNDSDANECGIVFLGMILSNDLVPWTDFNKVLYINAILTNIDNLKPNVYQPAAYSLGAALGALSKSNDQDSADNLFKEIQNRLHSLNNKKDRKCEKRFTDILYNIHKTSPHIVDRLREVICFKIPTAIGTTKRSYLEMILSRIESFEEDDVYNTIIGIGIKDLLKQPDFQLLALHILNRVLPMIKNHDITVLFELVEDSLQLQRIDCRDIGYEICIYAAQNFSTDLRKKAIKLILRGLSDPEVDIQKRIYQFWSKEAQISSNLTERILFLLQNYALDGERNFLGLCTQLILDPAIECPESKKQIFQFEDDRDSKLHEYHISTKLRSRATYTLPPMFAESTQARPSLFKATQLCSLVRNTNAEYVFEPTQDPIVVTQPNEKFTLQSQNSMPFQIGTQVLNRRSQLVGVKNLREDSASALRRRRFLKDKDKEQRDKVLRVVSVRQKNVEATNRKAIENDVGLYRRYRFGEYPDLLINNLAFLLPLQALARRDIQVAQQLFVASLTGILEARECNSAEFLQKIDEIFKQILIDSTTCDSTIFSALLEVSLVKPGAFNLPPDQVARVAKESKNLTLGALYLENRLISDWEHEIAETLEPAHWLQLADIYSSLKEYEVVSSIFADKLRTDPRLATAIELRANGRSDEAQTLLVEVIGRNVHMEHYYAYNCYYECSIELSDWSHVTEAINNEIDDLEELWTDKYNLNFLLPKLMHAKIQLLLEGDAESKAFLRTISQWMSISQKANHMKNEFCEELMMLSIVTKDYRQCRVLYENYLKKFLREWSITGSFCTKTKLDSLLGAQRVAEIDLYAQKFLNGFDEYCSDEVCKRWNSCNIDPTESLRMWNTIVGYRKYIAALASKTMQDEQIEGPQRDLNRSVYHMQTNLFNAADHQKNFALAQRVFDRLMPRRSEPIELITHELSRIKNIFLQTHRTPDCVGYIETSWKAITNVLNKPLISNYPDKHIEALDLNTKIAIQTIEKLEKGRFNETEVITLKRITNNKSNDLKFDFIELAMESLKTKVGVANTSPTIDSKILADSNYSLAQFSYDILNKIDSSKKPEFEEIFLESVLEAMKYGSKEACQLFPCVLQLSSIESGVLRDRFGECSADVPVWTYLVWIPQILSRFQLNEPCYLDHIVLKIADKHPEALRFPFSTWYKQAKINFSLSRLEGGHYNDRSVIRQIMNSLQHDLCDKFLKSFRYLAVPEAFLLSELESFDRDIRSISNISDTQFSKITENLLKDVYCEEEGLQGVAYRRLLKYKSELESIKNMSVSCDESRIRKKLNDIVRVLRKQLRSLETTLRLETICPWLANYQWCGEEECTTLPGQESNLEVLESVKIVRFGGKVQALVSKSYPLRISIHGSNGHIYDFLVKHGEDLKQDQRIQQILKLMSQKLIEDQKCQSYNLFIRTYQVIPIDRNCGILSWVKDTVSLNDFVINCFEKRCSQSRNIIEGLMESYLEFIGKSQLPSYAATMMYGIYGLAASKYTREDLIKNLRSLENIVDYDIVKKALMDLALTPGSFFALRNNFATSMSAMNIAHWILGIGDRHLKNTLIGIKDGSMTGIDFGLTFGSGTRDQKVPELVPFRLTSHLVNSMAPMGTSGLIFKCMVHSLRVFRSVDRLLMAYMEVFIREPSVNWLDIAMKKINEDDDSVLSEWEPKDRIDIARCKLQGYNPMYLFERELNAGVVATNVEYLEGYMKILRGHSQFNIRSRLPKDKLSVEDQVKCLIDQATDPAVLGISYVGFSPWI